MLKIDQRIIRPPGADARHTLISPVGVGNLTLGGELRRVVPFEIYQVSNLSNQDESPSGLTNPGRTTLVTSTDIKEETKRILVHGVRTADPSALESTLTLGHLVDYGAAALCNLHRFGPERLKEVVDALIKYQVFTIDEARRWLQSNFDKSPPYTKSYIRSVLSTLEHWQTQDTTLP